MEKIIYFILFSIICISCNNQKHSTKVYLFELSGYTYAYTSFGDKVVSDPVLKMVQEFTIQNEEIDSIIYSKINEYNSKTEHFLKKYYTDDIVCYNEKELSRREIKRSAIRSIIGAKILLVTVPYSTQKKYSNANIDTIIENYIKKGNPELQNSVNCYVIYDGTELNTKLLMEMENERINGI